MLPVLVDLCPTHKRVQSRRLSGQNFENFGSSRVTFLNVCHETVFGDCLLGYWNFDASFAALPVLAGNLPDERFGLSYHSGNIDLPARRRDVDRGYSDNEHLTGGRQKCDLIEFDYRTPFCH